MHIDLSAAREHEQRKAEDAQRENAFQAELAAAMSAMQSRKQQCTLADLQIMSQKPSAYSHAAVVDVSKALLSPATQPSLSSSSPSLASQVANRSSTSVSHDELAPSYAIRSLATRQRRGTWCTAGSRDRVVDGAVRRCQTHAAPGARAVAGAGPRAPKATIAATSAGCRERCSGGDGALTVGSRRPGGRRDKPSARARGLPDAISDYGRH